MSKTRFPTWLTKMPDRLENRFIRLGNSFLLDENVNSLSDKAFRVYIHMNLESAGKEKFTFPKSKYKWFCSCQGFKNAKDELIQQGFIEQVESNKNLRKANVYKFSEKWKDTPPKEKPVTIKKPPPK